MKHQSALHTIRILTSTLLVVGTALVALAAPPAPWRHGVKAPLVDQVNNVYLQGKARPVSRDGSRQLGNWVRTTGSVNLLAIPVEFKADEDPKTTGVGTFPYKTWGPAAEPNYLATRLSRMRQYYIEVSGSQLYLGYTLADKVTLSKPMADYGGEKDSAKKSIALMTDVVAAIDSKVDFREFDIIMLIHAGCGMEVSGAESDIWSHSMATSSPIPTADNVSIAAWVVMPETHCDDWSFQMANPGIDDVQKYEKDPTAYKDVTIFYPHPFDVLGVWAHEIGHALGMPDVYDTMYSNGVSLGPWSLMASGNYLPEAPNSYWTVPYDQAMPLYGSIPSHPDAWNKQLMQWVAVNTISGKIAGAAIAPVETSQTIYRLWSKGNIASSEYFLVENRAKIGWDSALPESGLMIYHIDDTVGSLYENDLQVGYRAHPRIMPESADNKLENGYMMREPLVKTTWPIEGNTSFTTVSMPNSRAYNGYKTNVEIKNIAVDPSKTIFADLRVVPTFLFLRPADGDEIYVNEPYIEMETPYAVDPISLSIRVGDYVFSDPEIYYDINRKLLRVPLDRTTVGMLNYDTPQTVIVKGRELDETGLSEDGIVFTVRKKIIRPGLRMVTIPVALRPMFSNTPNVFGQLPPGEHNVAWYDPALNNYRYYRDNALTYDPIYEQAPAFAPSLARNAGASDLLSPAGLGLWASLPGEVAMQLTGDVLLPRVPYEVPVAKGFNMIGSPYTFGVTMKSLMIKYQGKTYTFDQAVSKRFIAPVLYSYFYDERDPSKSTYTVEAASVAELQPFAGYWIYCYVGSIDESNRLTLLFQPAPIARSTAQATPAKAASKNGADWQIQLIARAAEQSMATVVVGVHPQATNLTDMEADRFAPPAAPRSLSLVSTSSDSTLPLMADFRAPSLGVPYTWNLRVSGKPGVPITISWPDLTQAPKSSGVYLRDTVTGESRYMRTNSAYTLTLGAEESSRQLTLTVAPGGVGALQVTSLMARPGRASGELAVTCQLTQDAEVSAVIRTLSGKLVRKLPAVPSANRQALLQWDGRDEQGRVVPVNTMYQCEVQAVSETGQSSRAVTRMFMR